MEPTASGGLDLIDRARTGDLEAFDDLCRQHGDRLLRQAVALSADATMAEDLVQETFIAAWRGLPHFGGRCHFFTWLCSILVNRHRNSRRKKWPLPFSFLFGGEREQAEIFLSNVPDLSPTPGTQAEREDNATRVLRSLEKLPAKQREVVYLRFYAGDSLQGIAAALDCSVGTVKSRLFHGLERLRRMKSIAENRNL